MDPKSVNSFEELSQKFLEEFSQQKRYAKDPTEIHGIKRRQNEGLQTFMDRFKSKSFHIKGVPLVLRISAFMHGHDHDHGHPELAKKPNDKIPKTMDELFERARAFIRGEVAVGSAKMVRHSQGDNGYIRPTWTEGPKKARNIDGLREAQRNMKVYTPYPRKDTFTLLIKTPKDILAMENVSFPEPPPLIGTPKKQNLNKFCDYHENTNDCYMNGSQGKNSAKVINMIREGENHKRYFKEGRSGLTDELTFPMIPQNQLTDEPIILEGIIKGNQVRRMLVDGGSSSKIMRNTSSPGSNRSSSNYGKSRKKEALWECRQLERIQDSRKERMMKDVLADQKGQNMQIYLEEIVIKIKHELDLVQDVKETLRKLKRVNIKIDPVTSPFRVKEGRGVCLLVQTLIHTTRSLRAIFRKHKVKVISDRPIEEILKLSGKEGRLEKWAAKIQTYDISYIPRREDKGSVVKKLFGQKEQVEETPDANEEGTLNLSSKLQGRSIPTPRAWRLYLGREIIEKGLSVGIILVNPKEKMYSYAICLKFNASNHAMDCEALLIGLAVSVSKGMKDLHVFMDSPKLVA
uniref:Reverse transcriptase domain-containing protein n=1 Tax=Tanacetum cinerariifolium TaxID=118510 RepID=A0A6L2LXZ6_TANCI|nr:reverse transcriptase domain-containing protein [Tanacetum cinerariifolium]